MPPNAVRCMYPDAARCFAQQEGSFGVFDFNTLMLELTTGLTYPSRDYQRPQRDHQYRSCEYQYPSCDYQYPYRDYLYPSCDYQ